MADIEKLIRLKDRLSELQNKLRAIGDHSLVVIKGCEDIDHSSERAPKVTELRDQAIKINYLAHEVYDELELVEKESSTRKD